MSAEQHHSDDRGTRRPRGACPRLSEPMETGDGLLARMVLSGPVPIEGFAALCAAARTHGNGLMEITARGSLQVRGLSDNSAPRFAAAVEALDIPFDDHVPVVGSPLPAHPRAGFNAQDLASEIRNGIAERALRLAPKVSVVVDDGGPISLDGLAADVRLVLTDSSSAPKVSVSLGGDGDTATPLGVSQPERAGTVAVNLLAALAASGAKARARDVVAHEGTERFLRAAGDHLDTAPTRSAARTAETIGLHRLAGSACAIGVALPFGQAQALDLIALARIAGANGADWVALAPQRTLLLGPIGEMTAFALGTAADTLGFIVDSRDPRRRIAACAGAPACRSGHIPSRELAARIAERLPQGTFALHISGCSKGCAYPRPAPLTIMGAEQGARIIDGDSVRNVPTNDVYTDDLIEQIVRRVAAENENA
ncbi:precorrin-3B synthase [Methyloceanibacter sp. wino2]|uniref:precorrin-3B synthase n=1 Tax=Methyloceanibacter sp. wino2 TaxID=2170729 RepID=UPI00131EE69F|nr:precorrin-3B synthase [Methyloceanibacter sp. wino2]